jgi:hypothetical protein
MMERMKVTARFSQRVVHTARTLMHVRTQIKFAGCAADTLSATINIPFPVDSPFFRRGIPALSIDFQDHESHVLAKRLMRLAHLNHQAPFSAKWNARRPLTGSGTAAETLRQIAAYQQFGSARNVTLFS